MIETKHTYVCDYCRRKSDQPMKFGFRVDREYPGTEPSGVTFTHTGSFFSFNPPPSVPDELKAFQRGRLEFCSVQCATESFRLWLLLPNPLTKKEKKGLFGRKG